VQLEELLSEAEKRYEQLSVQFEANAEDFLSKSVGSALLLQALDLTQRV